MSWCSVAGILQVFVVVSGTVCRCSSGSSELVQALFLLASITSHLASRFQVLQQNFGFLCLGCSLSAQAAAVTSIVLSWVFAGVIVLGGALVLWTLGQKSSFLQAGAENGRLEGLQSF